MAQHATIRTAKQIEEEFDRSEQAYRAYQTAYSKRQEELRKLADPKTTLTAAEKLQARLQLDVDTKVAMRAAYDLEAAGKSLSGAATGVDFEHILGDASFKPRLNGDADSTQTDLRDLADDVRRRRFMEQASRLSVEGIVAAYARAVADAGDDPTASDALARLDVLDTIVGAMPATTPGRGRAVSARISAHTDVKANWPALNVLSSKLEQTARNCDLMSGMYTAVATGQEPVGVTMARRMAQEAIAAGNKAA